MIIKEITQSIFRIKFTGDTKPLSTIGETDVGDVSESQVGAVVAAGAVWTELAERATDELSPADGSGSWSWSDGRSASECSSRGGTKGDYHVL